MTRKKTGFERERDVWLKAAGISASAADPAAYSAHTRTDAASVKIYGEAEEAATRASTAITVEAVFTPKLDALRHVIWCAAFVVYMQRHHAAMLPQQIQPPPDAAPWDEVLRAAEAARNDES